MTQRPVFPDDPWSPAFVGPGMYYLDADGVWHPVVGTPVDGSVPTFFDADNTVRWSTSGGGELLVDDASGELLFDDATGDVLSEG